MNKRKIKNAINCYGLTCYLAGRTIDFVEYDIYLMVLFAIIIMVAYVTIISFLKELFLLINNKNKLIKENYE